MKESITKFDLEAAFKALNSIETPEVEGGVKANRAPLTEIFSRKSKLDLLMEEYYDVSNDAELDDAQKAREAEVAAAKLARIEKIVDLDAKSPEDLLTSYVGKYIIQCPQCMTLFYKNKEDIEESEDDPTTVNVNEVCQHCGNESGYTLVGKVGAADVDESDEAVSFTDDETDESAEEETTENTEEQESDNTSDEEDLEDFDLEDLDFEIEDDEGENTEEAFSLNTGSEILAETTDKSFWRDDIDTKMRNYLSEQVNTAISLTESDDQNLDVSAEEFEQLIQSDEFKKPISDRAARAMMDAFNDDTPKSETTENLDVSDSSEVLDEGVFDNIKNAVKKTIDKLKSREAKADWILENTMKNYDNAEFDTNGEIVTDARNRRFNYFMVIGYKDTDRKGKEITTAPPFNSKDLEIGMRLPEIKDNYKAADNTAKGWSQMTGNGPAFIYLVNNRDGDDAAFLCGYFKGSLIHDQVDKYVTKVRSDLEGRKLVSKGGMNQSETEKVKASELRQGMSIKLKKGNGEVVDIEQSEQLENSLDVQVKLEDETIKTFSMSADSTVNVFRV